MCAPSFATARRAFVGSQSLRKDELENRREVGLDRQQPGGRRGRSCKVFESGLGRLGEGKSDKADQGGQGRSKAAKNAA